LFWKFNHYKKGDSMPNVTQILNEEVRRLAKKEIKLALDPLQKQLSALKKTASEQAARIKAMEKSCTVSTVSTAKEEPTEKPVKERAIRLTNEKIAKLRAKLNLTQAQFAALVGVNVITISMWETGKTSPRDVQKRKIAALRGIGKRELEKLIAGLPGKTPRKKKKDEVAPAPAVESDAKSNEPTAKE
jgi:DNA-binding transcriptional regulator YiaG